jgi:hypothetical protein
VALYNSNYLQKTTGFITQANYGNNQNYYWYINAHVNNQNYPPQSHPLVLQILPDGSLLSTKQLFDSGATIISSGFATADGEIFYSGTTNLNPDAGFDALVSAQSIANGDSVLWSKLYGEAGGINSEAAFYLLHTADDGFLMVGNYRTTSPLQTDGMLVIKTDAEGKVEWQKNFEQEGGSLTGRGVAETATGYAFMAYIMIKKIITRLLPPILKAIYFGRKNITGVFLVWLGANCTPPQTAACLLLALMR